MEYVFQPHPLWGKCIYFSFFILSLGSCLTFCSYVCFSWPSIWTLKFIFKICLLKEVAPIASELFPGIPVTEHICIVYPDFLPRCTRCLEQSMARNCFVSIYKPCWKVLSCFDYFLTPIIQALTEIQSYQPMAAFQATFLYWGFMMISVGLFLPL